ncbi:hypothetical protein M501DRAFT_987541 [Patellaria atrata CBS 101060]|uniref:DUF7730 domain-containing protein n=1 Tax=Patellaria atrata CBS 101060 TaxID=1346257 RepID=A0A9P4S5Q6_9PEZI|nr:hypothetical protein M501DRAFT_987541 [Patellaria atrata CBS 101060]
MDSRYFGRQDLPAPEHCESSRPSHLDSGPSHITTPRPNLPPGHLSGRPTISFLDLPAELRIQIYQLVFHQPGHVIAQKILPLNPPSVKFFHQNGHRTLISLLLTCHQVYIESIPYLYLEKSFHFFSPDFRLFCTFLQIIGPLGRANLESLTLLWQVGAYTYTEDDLVRQAFTLLAECANLDFLKVMVNRRYLARFADWRDVPGLRELRTVKVGTLVVEWLPRHEDLGVDEEDCERWLRRGMLKDETAI